MTPIQLAAFRFVAERPIDRASGRVQSVDLREIGEPMRQRIIDLAMMDKPLVDVDGPRVILTLRGIELLADLNEQFMKEEER